MTRQPLRPNPILACVIIAVLAGAPAAASVDATSSGEPKTQTGQIEIPKELPPLHGYVQATGPVSLATPSPLEIVVGTTLATLDVHIQLELPPGVVGSGEATFDGTASDAEPIRWPTNVTVLTPDVHKVTMLATADDLVVEDWLFIDARTPLVSVLRSDPRTVLPPAEDGNTTATGPREGEVAAAGTINFDIRVRSDNWYHTYPESSYDSVPVPYVYVELWDREGCCSGDYFMRGGYASSTGYLYWSFENYDGPFTGGLDPYIKIFSKARGPGQSADTRIVDPSDGDSVEEWHYHWGDNLGDGTYYFSQKPQTENPAAIFHILGRIMQGFKKGAEGGIFTPPAVTVKWHNGYTQSTRYDPDGPSGNLADPVIYLLGTNSDPDQWDMDVIEHEYGHHWMFQAYGQDWPPFVSGPRGPNCGEKNFVFVEGFATFYQAAAQASANYQDAGSSGFIINVNIEPLQANEGDCTATINNVNYPGGYEYSVVGTLYDIFDSANDDNPNWAGYDSLSDGVNEIWDILRNYRTNNNGPGNIDQLHDGWHSRGHDQESLMHEIYREHRQL